MPDYSKSKIYKIACNTTGKIYIGSTTQPIQERFRQHKSHYKSFKNGRKNYCGSFEIVENDNCEISVVLTFSCESNSELLKKEQEILMQYPEAVNKIRAFASDEVRREQARIGSSNWRKNHPERKKESNRIYCDAHREEVRKSNRDRNRYRRSMGGDERANNNLLCIDSSVFTSERFFSID